MRLAFYTYSYTDRQNMSIADCCARIARTGYAGIDESGTFGNSADPRSVTPERRKQIRDVAHQQRLSIEAVITHAELTTTLAGNNPLDLKGSIDLAAELGAGVVTFHMGGAVQQIPREELWERVVDCVRAAATYGATKHVALAVDGIWPLWIVNSPDALAKLFADVGESNFGVNFDPSYLTLMGVDPVQFVQRFSTRILHAHLKDHLGKYPQWEHRIPGQGEMDYVRVFRALAQAKFPGSVAVECFVDMKFEQACDEGFMAMSRAMREGGALAVSRESTFPTPPPRRPPC